MDVKPPFKTKNYGSQPVDKILTPKPNQAYIDQAVYALNDDFMYIGNGGVEYAWKRDELFVYLGKKLDRFVAILDGSQLSGKMIRDIRRKAKREIMRWVTMSKEDIAN